MYYERFLAALKERKIRYLIVGGLAVNLYGVPRMTADIDMMVALDSRNMAALLELFEQMGYKPKIPVDAKDLLDPGQRNHWLKDKHMRAFTFINPDNPLEEIDILLEAPLDFDAAYERRHTVVAGPLRIDLASIDDLILTKKATGRKQDESDIAALELAKKVMADEESEG